jgi:hypothetical protein
MGVYQSRLGWPQIVMFLISISQVGRITGVKLHVQFTIFSGDYTSENCAQDGLWICLSMENAGEK